MKTRALKNYNSSVGCEVYDINLTSNEELEELGNLIARQNIVLIKQNITPNRLHEIMTSWGTFSKSLIHKWAYEHKLSGRHWRPIISALGYTTKHVDKSINDAVTLVSFKHDDKDKPVGLFENGELGWHADQCSVDDSPRIIGLQSISDTANSQTEFLCTHDAYESLSSDMKSMIKELYAKHRWVSGVMAPDLSYEQQQVARYNQVVLDGTETRVYSESVTGLPGIKFPSHSFDGFVGMSIEESKKVFNELKKAIFKDDYVYAQDWQDGQIVFMDQEITLHRRPTNVKHGNKRTMARVITYWDKLFAHAKPFDTVRYQGRDLTHKEIVDIIDNIRKEEFAYEKLQPTVELLDAQVS